MTLPEENLRLEALVTNAPQDVDGLVAVMQQALRTVLVLPSAVAFDSLDGASPVMVPGDGFECVVAFTSLDAAQSVRSKTPYAASIPGDALIERLAPGLGLAIAAPTRTVVFDPPLLDSVRRDLVSRHAADEEI